MLFRVRTFLVAPRDDASVVRSSIAWLAPILLVLAVTFLWMWVALYNGFPVLFSDTGSYLIQGMNDRPLPPYRSPLYALFTHAASFGTWPIVIVAVQSMLAAFVVWNVVNFVCEEHHNVRRRAFVTTAVLLAAFSSVPWTLSTLLPDAFAGLIPLAAFLLIADDRLNNGIKAALAFVLALSVGSNQSYPPVALLMWCVLAVTTVGTPRWLRFRSGSAKSLAWVAVAIVVGSMAIAALNFQAGLGRTLSPARDSFLLGRLMTDGLAKRYLQDVCADKRYIACKYTSHLPTSEDEFLFHSPMVDAMGGYSSSEVSDIVHGTLRRYPVEFAADCAKQTVRQLAAVATGEEIRTFAAVAWNEYAVRVVFPDSIGAFRSSRQMEGTLVTTVTLLMPLHVAIYAASLLGCLLAVTHVPGLTRSKQLFTVVLLFLIIHAAVHGSASGVFDRYGARVAWLAALCACAVGAEWVCTFKHREV